MCAYQDVYYFVVSLCKTALKISYTCVRYLRLCVWLAYRINKVFWQHVVGRYIETLSPEHMRLELAVQTSSISIVFNFFFITIFFRAICPAYTLDIKFNIRRKCMATLIMLGRV